MLEGGRLPPERVRLSNETIMLEIGRLPPEGVRQPGPRSVSFIASLGPAQFVKRESIYVSLIIEEICDFYLFLKCNSARAD